MAACAGSNSRVGITAGNRYWTGGAVRPNQARDVRCPDCARTFATARIAYTDHGIPTEGQALIPRHNRMAAA